MIRTVFILVCLAATVPFGVLQIESVRLARGLAALSMEERQAQLFGPWFEEAQELARTIPPSASIDIVMLTPEARDIAVLSGGLLHPRDCRFFAGWEEWRRRERARFLDDDRAANAVPGPPPSRAEIVVAVDAAARPHLRIVAGPP